MPQRYALPFADITAARDALPRLESAGCSNFDNFKAEVRIADNRGDRPRKFVATFLSFDCAKPATDAFREVSAAVPLFIKDESPFLVSTTKGGWRVESITFPDGSTSDASRYHFAVVTRLI